MGFMFYVFGYKSTYTEELFIWILISLCTESGIWYITSRAHNTASEKEFKGSEQLRGPVTEYEA